MNQAEQQIVQSSELFAKSNITQRVQLIRDFQSGKITLDQIRRLPGPYLRVQDQRLVQERKIADRDRFGKAREGVYQCINPNCRSRNTTFFSLTFTGDEASVVRATCLNCGSRWTPSRPAEAPAAPIDSLIQQRLSEVSSQE